MACDVHAHIESMRRWHGLRSPTYNAALQWGYLWTRKQAAVPAADPPRAIVAVLRAAHRVASLETSNDPQS